MLERERPLRLGGGMRLVLVSTSEGVGGPRELEAAGDIMPSLSAWVGMLESKEGCDA